MMRNTSRGANLHVGLVVVLSQQIKMEDYTNGATEQYSEEQPAYQEQTYQQPNESGDGGRRFGRDDDEKKLFVGGLSVNTTEGDLRAHFSQFGKIANCILKTDNITGRSRCFGFVVYENKEDLEEALKIEKKQHVINDKEVDPKRANPREAGGAGGTGVKKIFVGGVPHHVDETQIRAAFSQHGNVESVDLPTDKKDDGSEVRKGFIFVSFDSEEDVAALVQLGTVELGGKSCDVREATPKQQRHDRGGFGGRGGRGGARGGGRGGFGGYGPNYNEQWGQGGQWGGPGGQYGGQGCDYSAYNGNYGYDYNNGYAGWGGWGPGGYSDPNYGYGYGGPAYGYPGYGYGDYSQSGWGGYGGYYGSEGGEQQQQQQQQQQPQQQSSGGNTGGTAGYKARGGATAAANKGYHPYSR